MSFFSELKRRNVFRVGVAYAVAAWLALQVADVLVNALELPAVWSKGLVVLLAIGFIPVLVFAWVYEMTPEGLKRESEVPREQTVTAHTARKLDHAVIVLLVIAIALFVTDRFVLRPFTVSGPAETAVEATAAPATEPATAGVPVVAVLPLQVLSTDQEGTFLASGLHDDLLTRLAKLQAFKVISRTSVMEYVDTIKNIRQIGRELGAGYIVEGGLQSIGGRVSINAQLIKADTDEHLWAETFNRALTTANLFQVQSEIGAAIANALHATLSPDDQRQLAEVPTENLEAYRAYLRGIETFGDLSADALAQTELAFSEAVQLDPEFADAWARLSAAYMRRYWEEGGEADAQPDDNLREQARNALENARALAPDSVETLLAESYFLYYGYRDFSKALIELGKAEAIAPHNDRVIALRGFLLRRLARFDEAADTLLRAVEANPYGRGHLRETVGTLRVAGRCREAVELGERALARFPDYPGLLATVAWNNLVCGGDAEAGLHLIERVPITTQFELSDVADYLIQAGEFDEAIERLAVLEGPVMEHPVHRLTVNNYLTWLYRQTGRFALADDSLERANEAAAAVEDEGASALSALAMHAALRGDNAETLALGQRMLEVAPADGFTGDRFVYGALRAFTIAGATDQALDQLEALLSLPAQRRFSRLVATDPFLAPLRADPRFGKLLAQYQPQTR